MNEFQPRAEKAAITDELSTPAAPYVVDSVPPGATTGRSGGQQENNVENKTPGPAGAEGGVDKDGAPSGKQNGPECVNTRGRNHNQQEEM